MPAISTLPPHHFLKTLAAQLFSEAATPLALAKTLVLLPNRRSCRVLQELLLQQAGGRAVILPNIRPIGDVEEEELLFSDITPGAWDIPMPISAMEQRVLLATLIQQWQAAGNQAEGISFDQASDLAQALVRFLHEVEREQVPWDNLHNLVPQHYAEHWQTTLSFLDIIAQHWPQILKEQNKTSPVAYRNALLERLARHWEQNPPEFPIIAAGSTGSIPATRRLLKVIASLPKGKVILPGLDTGMDEESWQAVDATHPHYTMKQLLGFMGVDDVSVIASDQRERGNPVIRPSRGELDCFVVAKAPPRNDGSDRSLLLRELMRPASTTHKWAECTAEALRPALFGITMLEASSQHEEASIIALMMRDSLETPGKRTVLVTHDRTLANRVKHGLERWDIAVDDSAGSPLLQTPPAVFLMLLAEMVNSRVAPVPLLALLRHPLCGGVEMRENARALELVALRGLRPKEGFAGIIARLLRYSGDKNSPLEGESEFKLEQLEFWWGDEAPSDTPHRCDYVPSTPPQGGSASIATANDLLNWLRGIEKTSQPFMDLMAKDRADVVSLLEAHVAVAEALAGGASRLWGGEAGMQLSAYMEEILQAAGHVGEMETWSYTAFLRGLLESATYRPPYGSHPRLAILSPQESRLLEADCVILGGLNEGSWPPAIQGDPWMNIPMRQRFGLPPMEKKIGMAAHDFCQLLALPEVVLTRAAKAEGKPTIPSRWLQRLETLLKGVGLLDAIKPAKPWHEWAASLHEPASYQDIAQPLPVPPLESRPTELFVTQVEKLMRDPYAIYASHILKLKALDPLDQDITRADFGNVIHSILAQFIEIYDTIEEGKHLDTLLAEGRKALKHYREESPSADIFWWARFERIAKWFVGVEAEKCQAGVRVFAEREGVVTLEVGGKPFQLKARADRIERDKEGAITLVDYKTGGIPSAKEIEAGFACQMTLEGLIAEMGGFLPSQNPLPQGEGFTGSITLEYWKLTGSETPAELKAVTSPDIRIEEAKEGIQRVLGYFAQADSDYPSEPWPEFAPKFSYYSHLARVREWKAGEVD